jgi:CheY-like chemotaxis protein
MTKPRLFLIDDNQGDGMLLDLAFTDAGRPVDITQARDGGTGLELLREAVRTLPFPYRLIVIDLNLPRIDGLELLARLHGWPELAGVPIVILTSSTNPTDRLRGLERNPGAFLIKPDDYRGLAGVVNQLSAYLFPESAITAASSP